MTPSWQNKTWRQRIVLILTIIVIIMLMMHPELRIFLPVLDALGLELLLAVLSTQLMAYIKPAFHVFVRHVAQPVANRLYALNLFMFGNAGPYVDARVTGFLAARKAGALAAH